MAAKIWTANYNGYEATADKYGLSAVVIVPSSRRIAVTSGQVGVREDGTLAEGIRAQMVEAFKVRMLHLGARAHTLRSSDRRLRT